MTFNIADKQTDEINQSIADSHFSDTVYSGIKTEEYCCDSYSELGNIQITDEAKEYISNFFVDIRVGSEGSIPITGRKIDSIILISKIYASLNGAELVSTEHAGCAVDTVMESLKDIGFDEDKGSFDVDMTGTSQSSSQRKRRNTLIEVIKQNKDEEGEKSAPKELVVETMVEKYGFEEDEVDYDIAKMCREGKEIYEPQSGEFATM